MIGFFAQILLKPVSKTDDKAMFGLDLPREGVEEEEVGRSRGKDLVENCWRKNVIERDDHRGGEPGEGGTTKERRNGGGNRTGDDGFR